MDVSGNLFLLDACQYYHQTPTIKKQNVKTNYHDLATTMLDIIGLMWILST